MSELKVVRWTAHAEAWNMEAAISGMGGVCTENIGWEDYLKRTDPHDRPYLEAVKAKILEDGVKVSGEECADSHVPVFSDGTAAVFTPAGWADLLTAIWGGRPLDHYTHRAAPDIDND